MINIECMAVECKYGKLNENRRSIIASKNQVFLDRKEEVQRFAERVSPTCAIIEFGVWMWVILQYLRATFWWLIQMLFSWQASRIINSLSALYVNEDGMELNSWANVEYSFLWRRKLSNYSSVAFLGAFLLSNNTCSCRRAKKSVTGRAKFITQLCRR